MFFTLKMDLGALKMVMVGKQQPQRLDHGWKGKQHIQALNIASDSQMT